VHFHQFMLEIHERLHRLQDDQSPDILPRLAREIAAEAWLLCFDEFHVSNIADAMILGRLFEALFGAGVVVVATSNWPPDQLYKDGLQRERFLPFIDLIEERMRVYHLDGVVDHRFEQTQKLPGCFHPLNAKNTQKLQNIFFQLTNNAEPEAIALPVQGRVLRITHAAKGIGFFNFDELCVAALGPADYLALAQRLNTVLIDGVPKLNAEKRNETTRFINLIDALYEAKVQLYLATETALDDLAPQGELAFPFQRTVSRLMEMQGEEYRRKAHLGG
jgi:cell division protein ZapE